MHLKVGAEKRPEIVKGLEEAGSEAGNQSRSSIRLHVNAKDIQEHRHLIADVIRITEESVPPIVSATCAGRVLCDRRFAPRLCLSTERPVK
jgi:hypothetical protein